MQDPGWWAALRRMSWRVLFPYALTRPREDKASTLVPITEIRAVWLAFAISPLLMLIVVLFIDLDAGESNPLLGSGLPLFGAVSAIGALLYRRRRMSMGITAEGRAPSGAAPSADASRLVGWYRTHFFFGLAFVEAVALFGFVGAFVGGDVGYFLFGLALWAGPMLSLAPSGRNVEHWDRQLQALGVAASLTTAMFGAHGS